MSKIFENYKHISKDYIPDNRPTPFDLKSDEIDTILPGGTCYNTFKLDKIDDEILAKTYFQATYTQGIKLIVVKNNRSIDIIQDEHATYVNVRLDKEDTLKFNEYNLDTKCQLKMTIIDEIWESGESGESGEESGRKFESKDHLYSKIFKIRVLPTLLKEDLIGSDSDKNEREDDIGDSYAK